MVSACLSCAATSRRLVHDAAYVYSTSATIWQTQKEDALKKDLGHFQDVTILLQNIQVH